jgi:hypothetical protein
MAKTEEQELSDQISRLSSKLTTYKKALTNPHLCYMDSHILAGNILWLEAEITELKAQLEIHQLIARMYNAVVPALMPS